MSARYAATREKVHKYMVRDVRGATMIEYALLASLLSVAAISVLGPLGQKLVQTFTNIFNVIP